MAKKLKRNNVSLPVTYHFQPNHVQNHLASGGLSSQLSNNRDIREFISSPCRRKSTAQSLNSMMDVCFKPDLPHHNPQPREFPCNSLYHFDPPITAAKLEEAMSVKIFNNPGLRHELNFNQEVFIRPKIDVLNRAERDQYWKSLANELAYYLNKRNKHNGCDDDDRVDKTALPNGTCHSYCPATPRLPRFLENMHEIILMVVDTDDQDTARKIFDVDIIMQQLSKGVCDIHSLVERVGKLLRCSCSSGRDEDIERIVSGIHNAVDPANMDPNRLVLELCNLMTIMETMKLVSCHFLSDTLAVINRVIGCREP
jgi:hypothetical protein